MVSYAQMECVLLRVTTVGVCCSGEKRYTVNENQDTMVSVRNKMDLLQQRLYKLEKAWSDQTRGAYLGPRGDVLGKDGRPIPMTNGRSSSQPTPTSSLQR